MSEIFVPESEHIFKAQDRHPDPDTEQTPDTQKEVKKVVHPDLKATFFRHGRPTYSREELISGQMEGELSEESQKQVEASAKLLADQIDKKRELVVMWSSPKNRAVQTSQIVRRVFEEKGVPFLRKKTGEVRPTKKLEMIRDFETAGDEKGSPFWDKLIEIQGEDVLLPSGKKMGIANWQESLHVLSQTEGFEDLQAEHPDHIRKRAMSILAHLEFIARKMEPPEGKTLRFIVFGHEEIVTPLLQEALGQGVESGTGPTYAEPLTIGIHPAKEGEQALVDLQFREQRVSLGFDPQSRNIHKTSS
ncbi:hypothetical protein A2239_01440 [Candidatus Uhrbacteria bacterium RIFOXYA2_FULL_40_9]|nr:MAG: hypothetical protein UT94_C0028G0010 [Candidatus Uhrbacteria bacterium GW2011_GWF2_40_263]OGL94272.1 MAG: hypothetical protein A2239_01440 [Candidatus Uhrbacteria bacterium RIFOXYA2_FULL_40_9]OGL98317.1 MAG: hypothetical protein A2332_03755 [Candidatus Uhrbacteria bacterium RIFOXYB2_FULL_41_18]HBK34991.1 hypothetical protein [Candidatus Uhrbacteria bacterium]HCB56033.1 hypothetical protein [Candidatus Uhrbacteria bacterium]